MFRTTLALGLLLQVSLSVSLSLCLSVSLSLLLSYPLTLLLCLSEMSTVTKESPGHTQKLQKLQDTEKCQATHGNARQCKVALANAEQAEEMHCSCFRTLLCCVFKRFFSLLLLMSPHCSQDCTGKGGGEGGGTITCMWTCVYRRCPVSSFQ